MSGAISLSITSLRLARAFGTGGAQLLIPIPNTVIRGFLNSGPSAPRRLIINMVCYSGPTAPHFVRQFNFLNVNWIYKYIFTISISLYTMFGVLPPSTSFSKPFSLFPEVHLDNPTYNCAYQFFPSVLSVLCHLYP